MATMDTLSLTPATEFAGVAAKTADEEWANGLSHAVGLLMSVAAAAALLFGVTKNGSTAQLCGCLIYCGSLVALYAVSTLSHWVAEPLWKARFRAWDQGLIYLMIAGNFTPFAVSCFHGWWHALLVIAWILAITGFVSKVAFRHRIHGISLWLYMILGWLTALGIPQLIATGNIGSFQLALAGGIAYTIGTVVLMNDHRAAYLHVGWHVLVIIGSACHFSAVWFCTLPGS